MGKGEIVAEKGAGRYTIKLLYGGKQLVQNRLNSLTSQIAIIADQIENVKMEIEELIIEISAQKDSDGDDGEEGDQGFLTDDREDLSDGGFLTDDRENLIDSDGGEDLGDDRKDDDDRDDGDDDRDDGDPENPEPDPEDPEPDPEPPDESNPPPLTGDSAVEGKITDS
jgi:hypothetical protein